MDNTKVGSPAANKCPDFHPDASRVKSKGQDGHSFVYLSKINKQTTLN